jgi:LuxR family maltose regulon positive regulatory protein
VEVALAETKLRAPALPTRLVRRSRLDELLDAGVDGPARLLLVSAPAGSGKSTLVAAWAAGRPEALAWLQAEEGDSDPARFWAGFVRSIGQALHPTTGELMPIIVGSQGDDAIVVPALVNALLRRTDPLIVVVDDYHLVDDATVHRGMERLVDLCPDHVSLVLATRMDPPFRLGRLRVRQQLAEVRGEDLRFAADEAPGLLGAGGGSLDTGQVDQLCDRTEGWAAGLVLAGLSLDRATDRQAFIDAFRGDDHLVVEYLRDELLASVDAEHRRRLLETSVLDQLTGGLVDAITGGADGARWLTATADGNQLLVGLDRTGTWFRYHHLLRDLLRLEAARDLPERIPDLHARAATWFEAQGEHGEAVAHRLAAGDRQGAAALMVFHGRHLLRTGQIATLRSLLEEIGDPVAGDTACSLLYGWCDYLDGRYDEASGWIETALAAAPPEFDRTIVTSLTISILLAQGDVTAALAEAKEISLAAAERAFADLANAVGATYAWAGRPAEARAALQVSVDLSPIEGATTTNTLALMYLAVVALEDGTTADAHAAATTAIETAAGWGLTTYHGIAPAHAIRARTSEDPTVARDEARHALGLARLASTPLHLGYVLTLCGDTLADLDDPLGPSLLAEARAILDGCPDPGVVGRRLARVESRHHLGAAVPPPVGGLVEPLTDRELAVLRYLPTTMSQREIAAELYVSLNTVKTHCRAIYRKLGVGDRKAAIHVARELDVV